MKYLKYILGAIVILFLLFIAKGMITPNVTYSSEIVVDQPVKIAWAVMNDESKVSEWLKGMTKMEHISGEKGEVGAVTRYTYVENGQESVIVETMKAVRPYEHVAMDFVMEDVMEMDYKVDFTEEDGKTRIKSTTVTKGIGMMMRSMFSFMKGSFQTQEDVNMNNLKSVIESNTIDYFPEPVMEETEEMEG